MAIATPTIINLLKFSGASTPKMYFFELQDMFSAVKSFKFPTESALILIITFPSQLAIATRSALGCKLVHHYTINYYNRFCTIITTVEFSTSHRFKSINFHY